MAFVCGAPVVTNRFSASKDVCGWSRGHAVAHRESRPTAFGVVMIQLPWFNKKDAPKTNLNFACGYVTTSAQLRLCAPVVAVRLRFHIDRPFLSGAVGAVS